MRTWGVTADTGREVTITLAEIINDVEWFLDRLAGVEGGEGQWNAWCPCHDDEGTEWKGLSVNEKNGKVLIRCHSCGAQLPEVQEALEPVDPLEISEAAKITIKRKASTNGHVESAEVIVPGRGMSWWMGHTGVDAAVWNSIGCIEYESGVAFVFEEDVMKTRRPPKDISWQGTAGSDAPPLWPLPGEKLPAHISIVEGESDCGTCHAAGLPYAFAVTKGAKAGLPVGWAEALKERGVTRLTVCGDTDEGGVAMRDRLSREAVASGLTVEVIRLETVIDPFSGINDLNGVWKAADSIEEFLDVVQRATQKVAERVTFRSVDEMEAIAEVEVPWLIPDLIAPGDKIILAAPQKSLKSWVALELTRSLVTCAPFLLRPEWIPAKVMNVGFVQEEGAPSLWARRIQMLGITGNPHAMFSHRTGFQFTDSAMVDEMISSAREMQLDMLILDPLQRMTPGIDENSSSETGIVWDEVFRIQQALPHLVVMIVHHANRTGSMNWTSIRGSSRHGGEVDLGIFIEKHPMESHKLRMWLDGRDIPEYLGSGEVFEIKYEIDRKERIFTMDGTEMTLNVNTPQIRIGQGNRDKVFAAVCNGHRTRKAIMLETGISDNTVRDHVATLCEEGTIKEIDMGKGKAKEYEQVKEET